MSTYNDILGKYGTVFPEFTEGEKVAVIVSGGMDSTILSTILLKVAPKVELFAFTYGQKQIEEVNCVERNFRNVEDIVIHMIDLPALEFAAKEVSANVGRHIKVPKMDEVIGDPSPITEVPFRNLNLLVATASMAKARRFSKIFCGFQLHDEYGYWDTTDEFVKRVNDLFALQRRGKVEVFAPFGKLNKTQELQLLLHFYDRVESLEILSETLTCYDPNKDGSCGVCPSCCERLAAFKNVGLTDPIRYREKE